jgi:ArsR family transcriptional regulator, virulence genes transcriptional regulator
MTDVAFDIGRLEARASEVAATLRTMGNDRRLMILCQLVEHGELSVGALTEMAGLSQSAMSQHLAKLRDEGMVTFRRDSQTLHYRLADERIETLIAALYRLYCAGAA